MRATPDGAGMRHYGMGSAVPRPMVEPLLEWIRNEARRKCMPKEEFLTAHSVPARRQVASLHEQRMAGLSVLQDALENCEGLQPASPDSPD